MKKKMIIFSVILLVYLMNASNTMAWFSNSSTNNLEDVIIGTIKLETIQPSLSDIRIKSTGTSKTYVRVRLIPKWTDNSLSTSNIQLNLNLTDWVANDDGYYYFKYYLEEGQITSNLLLSVDTNNLEQKYLGESVILKTVSEGVQITNELWRELWEINSLPYTLDKSWTP